MFFVSVDLLNLLILLNSTVFDVTYFCLIATYLLQSLKTCNIFNLIIIII